MTTTEPRPSADDEAELRARALTLLHPPSRTPHPEAGADLTRAMLELSGTRARLEYLAEHLDPHSYAAAAEVVRLSRLTDYHDDTYGGGLRWASMTHATLGRRMVEAILADVFQGRKDHLRDSMLGVAARTDRRMVTEPWWETQFVAAVDDARTQGRAEGREEGRGATCPHGCPTAASPADGAVPVSTGAGDPQGDAVFLRAARVVAGDDTEDLMWHVRDGALRVAVNCSDVFAWGTADAEDLTAATIGSFEDTWAQCRERFGGDAGDHASLLWVARTRGTRPQGAYYRRLDETWAALFDQAGPARDTDLFNPIPQPATPTTAPTTQETPR